MMHLEVTIELIKTVQSVLSLSGETLESDLISKLKKIQDTDPVTALEVINAAYELNLIHYHKAGLGEQNSYSLNNAAYRSI